jgi:Protein of unknown function (DUF1615)
VIRRLGLCLCAALVAGCAGDAVVTTPARSPDSIRADISARLPANLAERNLWAADVYSVLTSLQLPTSTANICAVLAVTEQESTYRADPPVPNLPKIARDEVFKRAESAGIPALAVRMALQLNSPNGKTYDERLDAVRTEQDLSRLYEDFIDTVPLGKTLLADRNPVRTAGPMQVSIAFAEAHAKSRAYPFELKTSLRHEVFTRRGGLYFGTAHLLDYPAPYGDQMIYRFADFNAGRWASRNAAFQQAVTIATGRPLDPDGDLLQPGSRLDSPGATERAVRSLASQLQLSDAEIRRDLALGEGPGLDQSPLAQRLYAIAESRAGRKLPRAAIPRIDLKSPKFTRKLTTEWFARRVNERYQRCLTISPPSAM